MFHLRHHLSHQHLQQSRDHLLYQSPHRLLHQSPHHLQQSPHHLLQQRHTHHLHLHNYRLLVHVISLKISSKQSNADIKKNICTNRTGISEVTFYICYCFVSLKENALSDVRFLCEYFIQSYYMYMTFLSFWIGNITEIMST